VAKAAHWTGSDAEARKRGEQTGLDTPVVHAVNEVNTLSTPPGEYGRKAETQRN
jgi:hypothetical protein